MGKVDHSMFIVSVCQIFGWTYNEYMDQPAYFLELVQEKLLRDEKLEQMKLKQLNRGKS